MPEMTPSASTSPMKVKQIKWFPGVLPPKKPTIFTSTADCCRLPVTLVIEDPWNICQSWTQQNKLHGDSDAGHPSDLWPPYPTQSLPLHTPIGNHPSPSKSVCKDWKCWFFNHMHKHWCKSKRKIKNHGSSRLSKKYNDFLVTKPE